jgi:hypothetical protein
MSDAFRFLGLISHIDISIPAPAAPCKVIIRDGQGQELSSAAASASHHGQQQSAHALAADGAGRSLQRLEQLGSAADKLYVVKGANASGLASLQQEIIPGMLGAWVKHVTADAAAQVRA